MSIAPFPLLVLPSWIDDSSRKPCLLDLAERVMICSPGVLHARPSNSCLKSVFLSLLLLLCFSICSPSPTQSFPPILFRFDQRRAVGFSMLEYASCPLRFFLGCNLKYVIYLFLFLSFSLFLSLLSFLVISHHYIRNYVASSS